MIAEEVAAKLAALGLGVVHKSIHIGTMPNDPNACATVTEYGGAAPDFALGTAGVAYELPAVQVVFRGEPHDYAGPRGKVETAYRGLAAVEAATLSAGIGGTSAFYHWLHPSQAPFFLQRDDLDRLYFAFNIVAEKELSS